MLAHGALVQTALVAQVAGNSAVALQAAAAAFTATGRAALFSTSMASTNVSYSLTGNAAALTPTIVANAGNHALAGVAVVLAPTLSSTSQGYAISWQAFSVNDSMAAGTGSFAVTGPDARYSYDIDLGGVGSSFSGGTFSRGRWRQLKEDERAAREAAELARRRIEDEAREAAQQRAAERRAAIAAARSAEDQANAERAQLRAFEDALGTFAGAQRISDAMQGAAAMDAAATAQARHSASQTRVTALSPAEQEEEEAVVHLLLLA